MRASAIEDPHSFLELHPSPVIFDEVQYAPDLVPFEVKLSATPRPAMASAVRTFQKDFGDKVSEVYVVHPGDMTLPTRIRG